MKSLTSIIAPYAQRPLKYIANCDYMRWHCRHSLGKQVPKELRAEKAAEKAAVYMAGFAVTSIVTKDALGCYYYVNQSLKNKKIPEEKRKFVAALDLANGVLMIATQIILTLTLAKFSKKLFSKFFDKYFDKGVINKTIKNISTQLHENIKPDELNAIVKNNIECAKNTCSTGFSLITSLFAAAIVAKRMIVPFISTPLASWTKEKIINKGKNETKCNQYEYNKNEYLLTFIKNNSSIEKLYETMKVNKK